jgi:hypothetical protein
MTSMTLSGVNATIALDDAGVTLESTLFGRTKKIPWDAVGGVHIEPGDGGARPNLLVVTTIDPAVSKSGVGLIADREGEAASWFIVVPAGKEDEFATLCDEIRRRVSSEGGARGASKRFVSP